MRPGGTTAGRFFEGGNMTNKVGIVGLGSIGLPIAANIMAKGFEVHGYRRSAMDAFAAAGGRPSASPKAMADACDVIVTGLPDLAAVEEAICGPNGILASGRKGLTIIELSKRPRMSSMASPTRCFISANSAPGPR